MFWLGLILGTIIGYFVRLKFRPLKSIGENYGNCDLDN
jgi:hypothetical protein